MKTFTSGPFTFSPASRGVTLSKKPHRRWTLLYGNEELAERVIPEDASDSDIAEAFTDANAFERWARKEHEPERVYLIDFESGDAIASFRSLGVPEMSPGLIDDRSRYWLRSANKLRSRPVSLDEFASLAANYTAPPAAWIAGLLPDDVLTEDPEEWRAPSSWEIRHVVGRGSFTHISGAAAAQLVGVTPQNFRKYTARDGASSRQNLSFAMWHLLLHRLEVKRLS